jgi:hypothetical protein
MSPEDILSWKDYAQARAQHRTRLTAIKRNRRIEVGPFVSFYFESFETMWFQVQERAFV